MDPVNILVLTDHQTHTAQNSIYELLKSVNAHPDCSSLFVVSRGVSQNKPFFEDFSSTQLWGTIVKADFGFDPNGIAFTTSLKQVNLKDFAAIILRLPAPVSNQFWTFLGQNTAGQILINEPKGILKASSKAFLMDLQSFCPPMEIVEDRLAIETFLERFPLVLKPFKSYGGKGLIRLQKDKAWVGKTEMSLEAFWDYYDQDPQAYLAMQFLKNVDAGDKRIVVIDGEVIGASCRLPAEGDWLCNTSQGGQSVAAKVDADEQRIIDGISQKLREIGIVFYGIDTLVDDLGRRVLSEINVMSIGGITQIAEQNPNRRLMERSAQLLLEYILKKRNS